MNIKYIIINLIGELDETSGKELFLKVEEISKNNQLCIILELGEMVSVNFSGRSFLEKAVNMLSILNNGSYLSISNFKPEHKRFFQDSAILSSLDIFDSKEQAKGYIESLDALPKLEISSKEINPNSITSFIVACENCSSNLRIRAKGNYACPVCKSKFYVNEFREVVMK